MSSQPVRRSSTSVPRIFGPKAEKSSDANLAKLQDKIKLVSKALVTAGYQVRREELKRGPGWRAMSGMCRAKNERLILIDRRLSLEEQAEFLSSRAAELGINTASSADNDEVVTAA